MWQAELVAYEGRSVLVMRVPRAMIPTGTASGRYLRRALGGDGKPACVPDALRKGPAET